MTVDSRLHCAIDFAAVPHLEHVLSNSRKKPHCINKKNTHYINKNKLPAEPGSDEPSGRIKWGQSKNREEILKKLKRKLNKAVVGSIVTSRSVFLCFSLRTHNE